MNDQTLTPGSAGPFNSTVPSGGVGGGGRSGGSLLPILVVLLGLGTLVFGVLTITFATKANTATKTLSAEKTASAKAAADAQKKFDDAAYIKAGESPFRAYTAPETDGSFVINFPKTWSSSVDEEAYGNQVVLVMNPDFVRKTGGTENVVAARVTLLATPQTQYLKQYDAAVKKGTLKRANTIVSGQPAYDFTGTFNDKKTVRLVVVPIRDKVLLFATEDPKFATQYNEILAQAKVNP